MEVVGRPERDCVRATRLLVVGGLTLGLVLGRILAAGAVEFSVTMTREELKIRLHEVVVSARGSVYLAATDCTFALVSEMLRARAEEPALRGRVAVTLQNDGRCRLPGLQPLPPPYAWRLGDLEPLRVDERNGLVYRREVLLVDDTRLLIVLSDSRDAEPVSYVGYHVDLAGQADATAAIESLARALWPFHFKETPPEGNASSQPRWSTTNHRLLTRNVLAAEGLIPTAIALVEEGNVHVDRLTNQFNNPQHSMRNLFQTVEEARKTADEWIAARTRVALEHARRGDMCCALFSLGQALHTIQDRKHGFIPLYRHLIEETRSDINRDYAPEAWDRAERETIEHCRAFLAELTAAAPSAVAAFKGTPQRRCSCDAVAVELKE